MISIGCSLSTSMNGRLATVSVFLTAANSGDSMTRSRT